MEITLNCSEQSRKLLDPNLHDGRLLGIILPSPRDAELAVADATGKRYCIALDGVLRLHAGDFWEGNIILDVTVSRGERVLVDDLAPLAFAGQNQAQSEAYLKSVHNQVVRESLFVIQLNPSYGCYLTAVCKMIRIYPNN